MLSYRQGEREREGEGGRITERKRDSLYLRERERMCKGDMLVFTREIGSADREKD